MTTEALRAQTLREAPEFEIGATTIDRDTVLKCAAELEAAIGEVLNGQRKPGKLPIEPMARLIAYARSPTVAPADERGKWPPPRGVTVAPEDESTVFELWVDHKNRENVKSRGFGLTKDERLSAWEAWDARASLTTYRGAMALPGETT